MRGRRQIHASLLAIVVLALSASACTGDSKDSQLPTIADIGELPQADAAWESKVDFDGNATPGGVLSDDVAVVSRSGGSNTLVMLDRETGDELWRHKTASRHAFVTDSALVVGALPFDKIEVFDLETGKLRFERDAQGRESSPAGVTEDFLVVADADSGGTKYVAGISLETGEEKWRNDTKHNPWVASLAEAESVPQTYGDGERYVNRAADSSVVLASYGESGNPASTVWLDAATGKEKAIMDTPVPIAKSDVSAYHSPEDSAVYHMAPERDGEHCSYRFSNVDLQSFDVGSVSADIDGFWGKNASACRLARLTSPLPQISGRLAPVTNRGNDSKPQWIDLRTSDRAWTGPQNGMPLAATHGSAMYSETPDDGSRATVLASAKRSADEVTWRTDLAPLGKESYIEAVAVAGAETLVQVGGETVALSTKSGKGSWRLPETTLLSSDEDGHLFLKDGGDDTTAELALVDRADVT